MLCIRLKRSSLVSGAVVEFPCVLNTRSYFPNLVFYPINTQPMLSPSSL